MRRALALLLVLTLAPLAFARTRSVGRSAPVELPAVDAVAAGALARGIPGLSIAVRKGTSYFVKGYGLFDVDRALPAERHTVYQIASVSKQFASAAVMRLVEEGTLRVEDRARVWLPELDSRFDAITIEHLLTHTSGVRDYVLGLNGPYEPKTQQEILALIMAEPPKFTPGTMYEYSNSGYFMLGMILERASSRSFDQLLRDMFFTPLSLHDTSYCGTRGRTPDGYYLDEEDTAYAIPAADMSIVFSAGALCSSANDLLRWTDALAKGLAVSSESYTRMTTPVRLDTSRTMPYGYGLGVDTLDGRRRIWHNGEILGFESHAVHFPAEDLTIVVLVNVIDPRYDRASPLAVEIARALR